MMAGLVEDLRDSFAELRETHISWVFLREDVALKVKKPVALGFLDFSTVEQRRQACEAEVVLNRRLSRDVYLGVVPIRRDPNGRHSLEGPGKVVDWAVKMARLADADRADNRLAEGRLSPDQLVEVAEHIAAFHRRANHDARVAEYGHRTAIERNVRENFEQTRPWIHEFLSSEQARETEEWQLHFLTRNEPLFAERVRQSRVRDGHGDLKLEHVYLADDGDLQIIDCIEFNERFRYGDVCSDVAFLAMDLTAKEHPELAEFFLAAYARATDDYDLYALIDFYESYRAFVRGKVASILWSSESSFGARQRARAEAHHYFTLALAAERRPLRPPMMIAVGGIIAAGKSTVADRLAARLAAPVVDTDRTRKHMLGVDPTEHVYDKAWSHAYDVGFTTLVYSEVLRRAEVILRSQRTVILDASFRSREMREAARDLARRLGVEFRFVECSALREVCRQRLRDRERGTSVSDGRLEIFDEFLSKWEPVEELAPEEHVVIDTSRAALTGSLDLFANSEPVKAP